MGGVHVGTYVEKGREKEKVDMLSKLTIHNKIIDTGSKKAWMRWFRGNTL